MTSSPDVLVIGAGVSGLTSGICLAESGVSVAIEAAEPPLATTSAVAGALWGTHLVGPDPRVPGWADATHRVFLGLIDNPAAGVHASAGVMAVKDHTDEPPEAPDSTVVTEFIPCDPAVLPAGYVAGWRMTVPMVSMPEYLGYLTDRFLAASGVLRTPHAFGSLAEAAAGCAARVLVNCTGTGARDLVNDPGVVPARGQIVVVANPGVSEFFIGNSADPDDLTYLFPHPGTVILGGTQERGNWSREPDPATAERILADCIAAEPRLAGARVLAHKAGLRPMRPQVRLDAEAGPDGRTVVHNYGHGGAGISLSWGCALDTARLVQAALA